MAELLVVDDRSSDATAAVAAAGGARVLRGAPLPAGWAGKAWALHQGAEAATGDVGALPRRRHAPAPGAGPRARGAGPGRGRRPRLGRPALPLPRCRPSASCTRRWRRRSPTGRGRATSPGRQPSPARAIVNGQCLLVRRRPFAAWGGWERVRGHLTEDVALARALRGDGRRVAFADAADLLDVRMYEGARETWSGWGRSLMGPDVNGAAAPGGGPRGPLARPRAPAPAAAPAPRDAARRAPARGAAGDRRRARRAPTAREARRSGSRPWPTCRRWAA